MLLPRESPEAQRAICESLGYSIVMLPEYIRFVEVGWQSQRPIQLELPFDNSEGLAEDK